MLCNNFVANIYVVKKITFLLLTFFGPKITLRADPNPYFDLCPHAPLPVCAPAAGPPWPGSAGPPRRTC